MQQQMWFTSELQKTKINVILVFKAYNIAITYKNVSKLHFLFWLFTALCEEDTKLYCNWIRSRTRKWDAREDSKKPKELGVLVVRQIWLESAKAAELRKFLFQGHKDFITLVSSY